MSEQKPQDDKYKDLYRDGGEIVEFQFEQIIHAAYELAVARNDQELRSRIEKNWEDLHGIPYFPSESIPVSLLGGPGQGKSAVTAVAAKRAAAFLGLNYVDSRSARPGKDDFYIDFVTLGGALSPTQVKGTSLPGEAKFTADDGHTNIERVMEVVLPDNVTKAKYARMAMIVLDDAPNAHPDVLTAIYDLLKPETDSQYSGIYYSQTGNTGDDGAGAKGFNTAIYSRTRLMYMRDKPEDFCARLEDKYRGDVAESFLESIMIGFFNANPELLNTPPIEAKMQKTQFSCSRTNTQLTEQMAQILRPYAWRLENKPETVDKTMQSAMLTKLATLTVDNVGRTVGKKISQHALRVIQDADPIARAILTAGKITEDIKQRIDAQYTTGDRPEDLEFSMALADALSAHTSAKLIAAADDQDDKEFDRVMDAFSSGVYGSIRSHKIKEFIQHCYQRLFNGVVAKSKGNPAFGYKNDKQAVIINQQFFERVCQSATKHPVAVSKLPPEHSVGGVERLMDLALRASLVKTADGSVLSQNAEKARAVQDAFDRFAPKKTAPQQAPAGAQSVTTNQPQSHASVSASPAVQQPITQPAAPKSPSLHF